MSIKLLLWLFAGISTLIALLVALLFFVDVNLYRTQIEQHVSTAFGREVVLGGPLSLEPSLTPRFTIDGLKIANPDWASRPFLAAVDKFDIRVSLLPLLRGELEIVALEFHGVDLLLEEAPGGANNFTFGKSSKPTALPAIERMSLYDAVITYAVPESPVKRLHLEQLTARMVPGQAVELEARSAVNAIPVTISARGEPPGGGHPHDPWHISLLGAAGDLSLRVEGSVADPADWRHGEYRLVMKGRHLNNLETLSGVALPDAGPYELGANIRFTLDEYVKVSDLTAQLGASELQGKLHWDMGASPPAIKIRLESQQLDTVDVGLGDPLTRNADQDNKDYLDEPFDIGLLAGVNLDVEVQVQRLDGLAKPVQDIVLTAQADQQRLRLADVQATVDGTQITASATLPWGERLMAMLPEGVRLRTLLQHAELDIRAQALGATYQYATALMGRPLDLTLSTLEATARPGAAVTIRAEAALNNKPVSAKLEGEALAALVQRPTGPWQELALEVRGDDIRLDASGSVVRPFEVEGFDISYALSSADVDALLPLQGAFSLTGRYADHPDRHLFDQLKVRVGRSDIDGRVVFYPSGQRPRLVANLDSRQLHLNEFLPVNEVGTGSAASWGQSLELGGLDAVDLDVEVRVGRLHGLAKPVQDIRLDAHASGQTLTLAPLRGTLDGTHIDARVQLPWGEPLAALGKGGISIQRLIQQADLVLQARVAVGKLYYRTNIIGHPVELGLTSFEASARPGGALQVSAKAMFDDTPVQATLQAEPLAELLQRPGGPWQNLSAEVRGGDIRLEARGSVERPLEASGFEFDYALHGAEIDTLLPLFNLVLPLEGAYSLTGRFADLPDRVVFDQLQIRSGRSDIGGRISVYQGQQRPRLVAHLSSEQIYLRELLPVSETQTAPDTERRVIPDYNLPIERLRRIDGEVTFKGKRLRTKVGDLGDISFHATLQDGVFRLDPFEVRGWAGARIKSDLLIDASQDPPEMNWQWIAHQLNYGVLLEQAGFAETVEGTMDVTLRLSGKGRTRREFLGDSNGKLIIIGQEGKFGSRRLDLWGSALVTTMLSRDWRREDVTDLNCMVARIRVEDGVASSDNIIVDTQRITIAATGTLDLESEALDLVFAPRPKRTTLVALTSPVHVTGTIAAPEVEVTVLPRNRMAAAGTGVLAGLINPAYLIFTFSQTGSRQANPCAAAVEEAMAMKGTQDPVDEISPEPAVRFSLLPGCTRSKRRPVE